MRHLKNFISFIQSARIEADFTKAQLEIEGDEKSSDFTSLSGSKEMEHDIGMNDLFVIDSSLISDMLSIKEGQEIISNVMIADHRGTTGGGLTSGHIRSLDVNNDCVAGGLDE